MYIKLLAFIFALHYAFGQDTQLIPEQELNGDEKYLNMSARGLEATLDLSSLSKLEVANFSNNAIAHLDWRRIETAPNLKTLDLSGNADLALPEAGPSVDLPLSVLNMSDCNVEVISGNALSGLKNLEVLDLRGNPISFEKSQIFETLETPPKLLIISKITKSELTAVCRKVDMKVEVIDDDMLFDCKIVRRDSPARGAVSKNREKITREVLVDDMLLPDTHMEMQEEMLNDDPNGDFEGSGDVDATAGDSTDTVSDSTLDEVSENTPSDDETHDEEHDEEGIASSAVPVVPEQTEAPTTEDDKSVQEETSETIIPETAIEHKNEDMGKSEINAVIVPELIHKSHEQHEHGEHQEHGEHHESMATENKEPLQIQAKQPLQKSTIVNVLPVDTPQEVDVGENKASESSASTGKNIILVLVIGAAVMGSVFGLMKVYKDRKSNAAHSAQSEGSEMKEMQERKPLIVAENHANGQAKQRDESCVDVAVVDSNEPAEMTTKEILNNPDGLPDIDDPSRLSTIIVSSPNLNEEQ